ncbi:helix-turn-helix domain-containing protein [Streptomyces syringium]|uniref:helix-turn-helix domain-containing protein n=1 Tax=Streptomyces syringium TaxID=76729 RepID=UPI0036A6BC69
MGQQAHRTARRRRLGAELRALREAAKVSPEEAAVAIHGDRSKISRQETGRHRVTRLELDVLLSLYKVKDERTRECLVALASEGHKRSWWRQYGETLRPSFKEGLSLESDATKIRAFQSQVIPGLLQTRPYASAVMTGSDPLPEEELEFYLDLRMERQEVLRREKPPSYMCIMPEGVLRQQIGGAAVMAEQLRRLVCLSQSSEMTIQVTPLSQTTFTCTGGSFDIFSYPEPMGLEVVQVEYLDGALYLEEDEAVTKYGRAWGRLQAAALPAQQSIELIASIARELESE